MKDSDGFGEDSTIHSDLSAMNNSKPTSFVVLLLLLYLQSDKTEKLNN